MAEPLPLPEYPRPQLRRPGWLNLNGAWAYAIAPHPTGTLDPRDPGFVAPPSPRAHWDGEITVPFSPEAPLSGVNRHLGAADSLFYRRTFRLRDLPPHSAETETSQARVLLHFGAVDQACRVAVNGVEVGSHLGGYLPFTFDITDALDFGAAE